MKKSIEKMTRAELQHHIKSLAATIEQLKLDNRLAEEQLWVDHHEHEQMRNAQYLKQLAASSFCERHGAAEVVAAFTKFTGHSPSEGEPMAWSCWKAGILRMASLLGMDTTALYRLP